MDGFQFDQRADSAVQCVRFLREDEEPVIRTAVTYLIIGQISDDEFSKIKAYCINQTLPLSGVSIVSL